ncbi:hypothetical protein Cob_v008366 [Colletotrichum orbiculare MAFF 240422]|uniref:Uncharacterized protein n=1 Tax=Colletotrichum orbiculare (strain 104-T / ATCC 96160 / CBS 514.97 / LARS 414 / MAFF 240422) TaxID=1213857 RepID=A0A484FLR7_COLOR|nr:hypothetical protein Cob_v008366 [Colletotrichum orbiculare MAFF 240422]
MNGVRTEWGKVGWRASEAFYQQQLQPLPSQNARHMIHREGTRGNELGIPNHAVEVTVSSREKPFSQMP